MVTTNLREKLEAAEAENRELRAQLNEQADTPDFENPSSVVQWYGERIVSYLAMMKREKAASRLRALNSAIDSWSKAYRLASDTSELEQLKSELDELRQIIEAERQGPRIAK